MYGSRLVSGIAAVLAGVAVLFAIFGLVYNVAFLAVTLMFGAAAFFMWYQASGRFARRLYRGVERQARVDGRRTRRAAEAGPRRESESGAGGGFGAGPREEWTPPREEQRRRARAAAGRTAAGAAGGRRRTGGVPPGGTDGPTTAEAYRTLGLDRGADQDAVKQAYREKVKEVHPDSPDGDEEAFKDVKAAYERLTDD